MGFRFFRRIRVAPGLTLNLSKGGVSASAGPRGAKFTVGTSGARATAGIPGSGLFYTKKLGTNSSRSRGSRRERPPATSTARTAGTPLDLGFFQRLVTSSSEEAFVDGSRLMLAGRPEEALDQFRNGLDLPDAAFMAGYMALKLERFAEAAQHFNRAIRARAGLGRLLNKYGIDAEVHVPVTEELAAIARVDERGARLGAVEALQRLGRHDDAVKHLQRLHTLDPADPVVTLSYVELVFEARPDNRAVARRVVQMTAAVDNESAVHAALLYYKARALRLLGLDVAARDALTAALRRTKDRPDELLLALRYERADVYEALGRRAQARKDLERIYAADPGYEDVAARLGV